MSANHDKNQLVESDAVNNVAEEAALLSESIVKMLLTNESGRQQSSSPQTGKLDDYFSGESRQTLPTLASTSAASVAASTLSDSGRQSPAAYLMQALGRMTPEGCAPRSIMGLENRDLFHKCTPEQMDHYDNDALEAIRNKDIDTLRAWHAEGRPLQTSSPFGDTLLHIACRRGHLDVVTFLVKEASVSLWVQDEQGRTPLHFGCHSSGPWFDLVDFIIQQDPDLLYVADTRGYMPLDYAPRETWGDWIAFLNEKELASVMPRRQVFFTRNECRFTPLHALPLLEDIDNIIADYIDQKKKKKKRLSSQTYNVISSSEDDTSWRVRDLINSAAVENLRVHGEGSSSSPLSREVLQSYKPSPHGALDNTEAQTVAMVTSSAVESRSSPPTTLRHEAHLSSTISNSGDDRIELLKLLKDLRIRHIIASTEVEIALEMEQSQGVQRCAGAGADAATHDASEECNRLSKEILEVQKKLEQSTSTPYGNEECSRIPHLGSKLGTRNHLAEEHRSIAVPGGAGQAEPPLAADGIGCVIPGDLVEDLSDTEQWTTSPIVAYDKDTSNGCSCKRLSESFESADGLVANFISCHCGGSGNHNCYLQLQLPVSQAGWVQEASGVILGQPLKAGLFPRSLGILKRRQSIGGTMRLLRLPTRDEYQCD